MAIETAVFDLGRADYARTHAIMRALVERVARAECAGQVLLVEHEPVYTAGRATPVTELAGAIAVERGGRVTYHGPGQLVVYPVLPLPEHDVRAWLQRLEDLGVAVCAEFGLTATPSVDGTGVFVGGRKVISIGVAIKRWVSWHGLAINVAVDLAGFARIRPCGRDPETVTDLTRLAGRTITLSAAKAAVRRHLHLLTATLTARPR